MKAKWIWYQGEFEVFHNLALHARREQYGTRCPAVWHLPAVYSTVEFNKTFTAEEDFTFTCVAHGQGQIRLDRDFLPLEAPVFVSRGEHTVKIRVQNLTGLPCIFIDSPLLVTDESWTATLHERGRVVKTCCTPAFTAPTDDPEQFPFVKTPISPTEVTQTERGILYDFGRETFAAVTLEGLCPDGVYTVYYGESRGEAMDGKGYAHCTIWEEITGKEHATLIPRGFRFVRVEGPTPVTLSAASELLDVPLRGSFSCDRPQVKEIFDMAAYTFHLCSREFYLDGIKRDRWVWGGDVREALMIGDYLFADREIGRRSLLSLLPKDYVVSHVNNINDYSSLTLIAVWEYYMSFGDADFIRDYWDRICLLYNFVTSRLDEDGQMVSRPGDWIFIDWCIMDKSGPLAAEQILLWQAHLCMARMARLQGMADESYLDRADSLRRLILDRYWREERGAFIDCYTSGKENLSRHGNIFAILFDMVDADAQKKILKNVLQNPAVRQITTPYFKLYELAALCKMGCLADAQTFMEEYWGGMLKLGATSAWEQYDPTQSGEAHYAMYGEPYGKSLCHAWSCGPVYFLGRYCLGVSADEAGYRRFTVAPNGGLYESFSGTVPTVRGNVRVSVSRDRVEVFAEMDGGILRLHGREYPIPCGKPLVVEA